MMWVTLGLKLFPLVVGAIHAVERIAKASKGREKEDAAVDAVGSMVAALEASFDKEVVDESDVQEAIRGVIRTYVHLQNVVRDVKAKRERQS